MAVVYEGWDERLERPVALKVLASHLAGDAEFRERFLREARLASRLHHPGLVGVYDITELDRQPTIVMELVPGGTLEHGRLTEAQAADVADALAHAHREGVIHRDLKPANLLRGPDGTVKIADFGIARAVEETMVTQVGTVLGTLRYLSPEQAAGEPVGPEADVYSLGVVLDELLPAKGPAVRAVLGQCRHRDPRRRPTADEVAAVLRHDTFASPTRVLGPRRVSLRRPRIAYALVLGAVAAVAAAIGVAATSGGNSPKPAPVTAVPRSTDPAQQARSLAAWLERYSR